MQNYKTIAKKDTYQKEIKKSKFIVHLAQTNSEAEANEFIETIKKQESGATHNCFAFIVQENVLIERMSDDGEPSGTAGSPILNVLQQQGIQNVTAVVTRYFGGIKLGAGGLIRAYSSTTAEGIKEIGLVENRLQQGYRLQIPYHIYDKFENYAKNNNLILENKQFATDVSVDVYFDLNDEDQSKESIINEFQNQIQFEKTDQEYKQIEIAAN